MRLCRFNNDRLGSVEGDVVRDVTAALDVLPEVRWPLPAADPLVAHLVQIQERIKRIAAAAPKHKLAIVIPHHAKRLDYEVELTVVIGRQARDIRKSDALSYVAGYCIGLDMTVRGVADRSFRKSSDSFTVLGPWLVTADEIPNPGDLLLSLEVNAKMHQRSSTAAMTVGVERLIELAAANYTLHPGDVIMTGTPEGVGPVVDGDTIKAHCQGIGDMTVPVKAVASAA